MLQLHTICSPVQFNTIQTKLQLTNQVLLQASEKIFLQRDFFFFSLEWLKEARDRIKSSYESLSNMHKKVFENYFNIKFTKNKSQEANSPTRGDHKPIL